jgi:hypothetical protein
MSTLYTFSRDVSCTELAVVVEIAAEGWAALFTPPPVAHFAVVKVIASAIQTADFETTFLFFRSEAHEGRPALFTPAPVARFAEIYLTGAAF